MKRWALLGIGLVLLTGCANPLDEPSTPVSTDEQTTEETTSTDASIRWTREEFKDVYDAFDEAAPLLAKLEEGGLTPYRETFERVAIAGDGVNQTYATIYPFQLEDGTYATVYEDADGAILPTTESVAPLFWQEASFMQFVEEIEQRPYGTDAPPTDVTMSNEAFQALFDRHAYTSALLMEADASGVTLERAPLKDVIIAGNGETDVTADLYVFRVEDGYAIVYDQDGDILKAPESIAPLFWTETDYEDLLAKQS